MAFRMPIPRNSTGLTEFMNVSAKVGTESDCVNRTNDVEAVQRMLNLFIPQTSIFKFGFGLCKTNGTFDALLGFYLFKLQRGGILAGFKSDVVDGCVSIATGFGYGAHTQYTIVAINQAANNFNKVGYDNFMATFRESPNI